MRQCFPTLFVDAFGQQIDGEFLDKLRDIQRKEKPICIAWDGMSLVDDVGGVGGFCEFLETINGNDPEEKKHYKTCAKRFSSMAMPKVSLILSIPRISQRSKN